jgi:VanZ family protein
LADFNSQSKANKMTVKINQLEQQSGISHFCYYWLPPLLLTAGIFFMAGELGSVAKFKLPISFLKFLLPSWSMKEIHILSLKLRKIGHFMAYAVLCMAYVRAWYWHLQMSRMKAIMLALAICLLVSASDETWQAFHESRTGCPRDVALDMSGALTAALVLFPLLQKEDQRE